MIASGSVRLQPKVECSGNVIIFTFTTGKTRPDENMLARELATLPGDVGTRHLLLDFTNLTYINSTELGTLIGLHKNMKALGGRLTLFNVCGLLYEVFEVTRLDTLLDICREAPQGNPLAV